MDCSIQASLSFTISQSLLKFLSIESKMPCNCCRKGDPFQGPKLGSCLTLGNELPEETHVLTKQEILLGRAPGWRAGGWGNPGELLCHVARSLRVYVDGFCFLVVSDKSFRVLPGDAQHCSDKMDVSRKDSGRWLDTWSLLLTFPKLFWLVVAY